MRELPLALLELAKTAVTILSRGDSRIEELRRSGTPICEVLTDPSLLEAEFPSRIPGTPYYLFFSAKEEMTLVVVVDEDDEGSVERVIREASLGMQDNIRNH